jgi:hypothetical protein
VSEALVNEHNTAQVLPLEEPMDFESFVVTFDDTRDELEAIERQLAVQLDLRGHIRIRLIELDKAGKLIEDEVVAAWHRAYTSYLDWIHQKSWEDSDLRHVAWAAESPPLQEREPCPPSNETKQEAAQAAFSL